MTRIRLFFALLCFVALAIPASGQMEYFGKNKVQYVKFNWYYIQTDHFDIYFTQRGKTLAEFTAVAAESAYSSISTLFRYQLVNRVPIIVYNSHNEFQQTNVVSEYLEEGIGGVTELFKNRVVLPYEGDYKKFRHVIHHELVHAVINDMFYGGSIQSIISNNITLQLPLWFNEGLSEYEAQKWETDSDMFLRDATVHEYLPPINQLYGYFAYRGGQSLFWYISRKYGDQKIGEILNRIKSTRNVEAGFRGAIGLTLEELSERWQKDMKVLYWPDISKREDPADYARRLTDHKKDGGFYNTSPAITPQGDKIAFISNRDEYFDVFVMNAVDGSRIEKLVAGQQTNNLEELHLLTPGISWAPDGKRIAIAAKAGEEDAILLIDVASGNQEKLTLDLDGIFSVSWSPGGDKLAFVGNNTRQSDIYIYDLSSHELKNLTDDLFSDSQPSWSPAGEAIYFASDRGSLLSGDSLKSTPYRFDQQDIYSVRLSDRVITRLTEWGASSESSPVCSPDGKKLLFISDRSGINNIYELDLASKTTRPITNSLSGVYQLSMSRDGSKLAFASLNRAGFDIFLMRSPFERTLKGAELEPTEFIKGIQSSVAAADTTTVPPPKQAAAQQDTTQLYGKDIQIDFSSYVFKDPASEAIPSDSTIARMPKIAGNVDENGNYHVNKYKLNFTPDIIYGNAGYDTFYGVTGTTVMAFSDLMGDHQIVFSTNLQLDLKNSDYALQYYYLPNRIDYGIGGFHSARFIYQSDGSLYRFRTYGAEVMALFPFDRFRRVEFSLSLYNMSRENLDFPEVPIQTQSVLVPGMSYTYDTSLWGLISPATGTRYKLEVFGTPKLGMTGISFVNLGFDYRNYVRLGKYYTLALRLAGGGSFGRNPQKFVLGGVDNWINRVFDGGYIPIQEAEDYIFLQLGVPLRGYNYNAAFGSRYGLFNFELRYPLLAFLQAGPLPLGLQSLGGVMFFDMGTAWNKDRELRFFTKDPNGTTITQDLMMGMGTGARLYFLGFLVRFDVAWAYNANTFTTPKYYFSLGYDF
jgi:Tol biopolymer transport system component